MYADKLEAEQIWHCMMAESRQAVSSDSSGEGRDLTLSTVGDGLQGYRSEPRRERMASESSGESEVSLDAGVDLAQVVGGRLASPHNLRNFRSSLVIVSHCKKAIWLTAVMAAPMGRSNLCCCVYF